VNNVFTRGEDVIPRISFGSTSFVSSAAEPLIEEASDNVEFFSLRHPLAARSQQSRDTQQKLEAIAQVLSVAGLLENLTVHQRNELMNAIHSILDQQS
jgi:hypothetical protein